MVSNIQKRDKLEKAINTIAAKNLNEQQYSLFVPFVDYYLSNPSPVDTYDNPPQEYFNEIYSLFKHSTATSANKINLKIYKSSDKTQTYIDLSCNNMPFAVGSVLNLLSAKGIYVYSQQNIIIPVVRQKGKVVFFSDREAKGAGNQTEKLMVLRFIIEFLSPPEAQEFHNDIYNLCRRIQQVTGDWKAMEERVFAVTQEYRHTKNNKVCVQDELKMQFLTWLTDNKCLFLGFGKYAATKDQRATNNKIKHSDFCGRGLGLFSDSIKYPELNLVMAKIKPQAGINFFKLPVVSMIHRKVYIHVISIGIERGKKIEEYRFLLLYSFDFFNSGLETIPYIKESFKKQVGRFNLQPNTYKWRMLRYSLSCYPRDELLQVIDDDIFQHIAERMMEAFSATSFRSIVYYDKRKLFVNAAILAPREDYGTAARRQFEKLLREQIHTQPGEFNVLFSEERLARVFLTFPLTDDSPENIISEQIESKIAAIGEGWRYRLRLALMQLYGDDQGVRLYKKYVGIFSRYYRDNFDGHQAAYDLKYVMDIGSGKLPVYVKLIAVKDQSYYRLRLFSPADGLSLSRLVHILENAGAEPITSRPYFFAPAEEIKHEVRLLEFRLTIRSKSKIAADRFKQPFEETISAVYCGLAEDDSFNRLAVRAALSNKDIMLLRSWANYLSQLQGSFSRSYIEDTLCDYANCSLSLVNMFKQKFLAHSVGFLAMYKKFSNEFNQNLKEVPSLEQDQILCWTKEIISAISRTNFYLSSASGDINYGLLNTNNRQECKPDFNPYFNQRTPYLSFKLNPTKLSFCEEEQPRHEIFVYSADFEGVHLRNGPQARGGIRWSDKRAGYRNEIYQLVAAQIIKNAIIVPTGAKGGFYIKNSTKSSKEIYSTFINALLELTDNYMGGKIITADSNKELKIYDNPDPYLVVAPDKGTADFSDTANAIAKQRNFWLDDAFASSGSSGYSHKEMGITARGAWESVKRSFAELGIDADKDPIEVIGVGDMSGDVFGNGMLLSSNLRLICAFNHRNIFIDPNPNPQKSFYERQKMFNKPGSTWQDYNKNIISTGGGVFERSAKSIKINSAIKRKFKMRENTISPAGLIRHILKYQADLLWLGGIGTYVKGSKESNSEIGDKLNDNLRINGKDLKVKVVGEGANLGLSLQGRIEFDQAGGKVATDSNDNSGGVHCSDREVNIKILLSLLSEKGLLAAKSVKSKRSAKNGLSSSTKNQLEGLVRTKLLKEMTEDISKMVLEENLAQNLILSLERFHAKKLFSRHYFLMRHLGAESKINFSFDENPGYLTRPQLAILFGICKNNLKQELMEYSFIRKDSLINLLSAYFPPKLAKIAGDNTSSHFLADRILDVQVINYMVDNLGLAFWADITKEELTRLPDYAKAFFALDEVFGFISLNRKLSQVPSMYPKIIKELFKCQSAYIITLKYMMQGNLYRKETNKILQTAKTKVNKFRNELAASEPSNHPEYKRLLGLLKDHKEIDKRDIVSLIAIFNGVNVLITSEVLQKFQVSKGTIKHELAALDHLVDALETRLGLDKLINAAESMEDKDRWHRIMVSKIIMNIYEQERRIITALLPAFIKNPTDAINDWSKRNNIVLSSYDDSYSSIGVNADIGLGLLDYILNLLKSVD